MYRLRLKLAMHLLELKTMIVLISRLRHGLKLHYLALNMVDTKISGKQSDDNLSHISINELKIR